MLNKKGLDGGFDCIPDPLLLNLMTLNVPHIQRHFTTLKPVFLAKFSQKIDEMHIFAPYLVRHSFEDSSGILRKIGVFTNNPRRNVEGDSKKALRNT